MPIDAPEWTLIVNGTASSVRDGTLDAVSAALGAPSLRVELTEARGHATHLAAEAVERGAVAVIVLGGDGTLNEAANGLVGTRTILAPVPAGSTNVLARSIGLANDPVLGAAMVGEALRAGSFRTAGLGLVDADGCAPRRFLLHLGIGLDATVVAVVDARPDLKRRLGHAWFVAATADTLLRRYDRTTAHFDLAVPGEVSITDLRYGFLLNSDPYTYLGRRRLSLAPGTSLDRLTFVGVRGLGLATTVRLAGSALGSGRLIATHPDVVRVTDLTSCEIEATTTVAIQVDGEYVGDRRRLTVRHEPDVLRLVRTLAPHAGRRGLGRAAMRARRAFDRRRATGS